MNRFEYARPETVGTIASVSPTEVTESIPHSNSDPRIDRARRCRHFGCRKRRYSMAA